MTNTESTLAVEPLAKACQVIDRVLVVQLDDGREIRSSISAFARLRDAPSAELSNVHLVGRGVGLHWPDLDEDLSVAGLLRGFVSEVPDDPKIRTMIQKAAQ